MELTVVRGVNARQGILMGYFLLWVLYPQLELMEPTKIIEDNSSDLVARVHGEGGGLAFCF